MAEVIQYIICYQVPDTTEMQTAKLSVSKIIDLGL